MIDDFIRKENQKLTRIRKKHGGQSAEEKASLEETRKLLEMFSKEALEELVYREIAKWDNSELH